MEIRRMNSREVKIFNVLDDYIRDIKTQKKYLILYGELGIGKSYLINKWTDKFKVIDKIINIIDIKTHEKDETKKEISIMRTIMKKIKKTYGVIEDIPYKDENIKRNFISWLLYITKETLIIVDNLDDIEALTIYKWIPEELPRNVAMIILTSDKRNYDALQGKNLELNLENLEIMALNREEKESFINKFLEEHREDFNYDKTMLWLSDSGYSKQIINHSFTGNPLFLETILIEIIYATYDDRGKIITDILQCNSLVEIFNRILERIENDYNKNPVKQIFTLLNISKNALSTTEMNDIVGNNIKNTILKSRLFLINKDCVAIKHKAIVAVINQKYFSHIKESREILIDYFLEKIQKREDIFRTTDELLYQLKKSKDIKGLYNLLINPYVFIEMFTNRREELLDYLVQFKRNKYNYVDVYLKIIKDIEEGKLGVVDKYQLIEIKYRLANFLKRNGNDNLVYRLYLEVLKMQEQENSVIFVKTIDIKRNIADVLFKKGEKIEALKKYSELIKLEKRVFRKENLISLTTNFNLATVLISVGREEDGLSILKELELNSTKVLGDENRFTLNIKYSIAKVYEGSGRCDEAINIYLELFKIYKRIFGKVNSETVAIFRKISVLLKELADIEVEDVNAYLDVLSFTLKIEKIIYEEDNEKLILTENSMAEALLYLNRYDEAIKLYTEILEKEIKINGKENKKVLDARLNLASTLYQSGKIDDSIEMYIKIIDTRDRIYGEYDEDGLTIRSQLAYILASKRSFQKALQLYTYVAETREYLLGNNYSGTVVAKNNAADILYELGKMDGALRLYNEVIEYQIEFLGEDSENAVKTKARIDEIGYLKKL